VVIAIAVAGGIIVSIVFKSAPGSSTTTNTNPSSSPSVSSSGSQVSTVGGFSGSAYYEVVFSGMASANQENLNKPFTEQNEYASMSGTWVFNIVLYYTGCGSCALAFYQAGSSDSFHGTEILENPSQTCTVSSSDFPAHFGMSVAVDPDTGFATNNGGTVPWGEVGANSASSGCGDLTPPPLGEGWTWGAYNATQAYTAMNTISFPLSPGTHSLSGQLDTTNPGVTSYSDSWSGSVTVTQIQCSSVPASLVFQGC
jgi:hypothetical protein